MSLATVMLFTVNYLGNAVGQGQVLSVHAKVTAIQKYPGQTTQCKNCFMFTSVQAAPRMDCSFGLQVDASDVGAGVYLF